MSVGVPLALAEARLVTCARLGLRTSVLCGVWRAPEFDVALKGPSSSAQISSLLSELLPGLLGIGQTACQPLSIPGVFSAERTLRFGMCGGPSMYLLFGTCRGQGGCSRGLRLHGRSPSEGRHVFAYCIFDSVYYCRSIYLSIYVSILYVSLFPCFLCVNAHTQNLVELPELRDHVRSNGQRLDAASLRRLQDLQSWDLSSSFMANRAAPR